MEIGAKKKLLGAPGIATRSKDATKGTMATLEPMPHESKVPPTPVTPLESGVKGSVLDYPPKQSFLDAIQKMVLN